MSALHFEDRYSHQRSFIFLSADIYFKGYIIYVMGKGFKQVLEFQAPYYFDQCVGQLKKNKNQTDKYVKA